MTSCDGEANGKWYGALDVRSTTVAYSMNDKNENEGDKSLDEDALTGRQRRSYTSDAQAADVLRRRCCLQPEKTTRPVNNSSDVITS